MALPSQEVSILGPGIQANAPSEGAFALNMLYKNNCWQVRKGFGQVTQFDSTIGLPVGGSATSVWGYKKHLGSHLMRTNFGNEQILSVFLSTVNSSAASGGTQPMWSSSAHVGASQDVDIYLISIYDITTGERYEVPLYRHTSQKVNSSAFTISTPGGGGSVSGGGRTRIIDTSAVGFSPTPVATVQPHYQTSTGTDNQSWVCAKDEFFYFEEFGDVLYFGNTATGTWAYIPSSFNGLRRSAISKVDNSEWMRPYGETSIVVPLALVPGADSAGFEYLALSDLPTPIDVSSLLDRMCFASGRQVFFSDQNRPASIKVLNVIDVPSEGEITAIAEQNGNLIIFTDNETWFYQPSLSDLLSDGKLTRISEDIGCVGPNSIQKIGSAILFVDTSGIYMSQGNLSISKMSEDIDPFFTDSMPNPLTNVFLSLGYPGDGSSKYYKTSLAARLSGVKATYSSDLGALIFCFPELNGALCSTEKKWSWWSFDSISTRNLTVGVTQNLPSPWVLSSQSDLFMLAGPDIQSLTDSSTLPSRGVASGGDTVSRSFFICRYGRGGGIDRSVGLDEDHRLVTGRYRFVNPQELDRGAFYFDEPTKIPAGFNFIEHGADASQTMGQAGERDFFLPISIAITSAVGGWDARRASNYDPAVNIPLAGWVSEVRILFAFDTNEWEPVIESGGTTDVVFDLPTERLPTNYISSLSTHWSVVRSLSNGTASSTGGYICAKFDGTSGITGNLYNGNLNLPINRKSPFMRIAMRKKNTGNSVAGMGIEPGLAGPDTKIAYDGAYIVMPVIIFDKWYLGPGDVVQADGVAQPVDWAYRSATVGLGEGKQVKFRGIYADVLSHGVGDEKVHSSWQYGLMNTIASSDRRDLAAQILDIQSPSRVKQQDGYSGTLPSTSAPFTSKATVRKTVKSATTNSTIEKVFSPDTSVRYAGFGSDADQALGNVLIGDEDVNQVAISMGVKGQSFNVMIFGFIRNKAERLFIEGVRAALRVVGGRRRKGR